MNPNSTMVHNTQSSPITSHKTVFIDSSTESDSASTPEWSGPENQLGLEPEYRFGRQRDNRVNMDLALDKKGEIK